MSDKPDQRSAGDPLFVGMPRQDWVLGLAAVAAGLLISFAENGENE
jgi:type IV secretory pathway VirB3-like protein